MLEQTFSLTSFTRSDGYAESYVQYFGDDGLVLGTYSLYDALDNHLGTRVFYFSVADGLHDLGSLVEGGLPANGWDYLADSIRANGLGQILGHGNLISQTGGQMAYLLTPAVPEPTSFLILVTAAAAIFFSPRRFESATLVARNDYRCCLRRAPRITHAATVRTVALSGQHAPGTPEGVYYGGRLWHWVVLNDAGQTAFRRPHRRRRRCNE